MVDYSPEKAGVGGFTPSRGTFFSSGYKKPGTSSFRDGNNTGTSERRKQPKSSHMVLNAS